MACSRLLQVSTPNSTGTPVSNAISPQAEADLAIDMLVVRGLAADHGPQAQHGAYRPDLANRSATSGISQAPGTQATSIASSATPWARSVATAPSSSLPVIVSL
jgi:hypothetical protein